MGIGTILAPFGFVAGWLILTQRPGLGPDGSWILTRLFFLLGVLLFVPAISGLRFLVKKGDSRSADIGKGLAYLGLLALTGQFAIDLAVSQLPGSSTEISPMFGSVYASSPVILTFQILGVFFYIGLFILMALLIRFHRIPQWAGILALIGIIVIIGGSLTNYGITVLLGFVLLGVGLAPIGTEILSKPVPAQN